MAIKFSGQSLNPKVSSQTLRQEDNWTAAEGLTEHGIILTHIQLTMISYSAHLTPPSCNTAAPASQCSRPCENNRWKNA